MFDCVACQPIFNTKKDIYGYELLYRADVSSEKYDATDGSSATRDVLVTAFSDIGIDKITGGKKAFVNFTSDLILEELPLIIPSRILVVELLEDIQPTEEMLMACTRLKERGYIIALDDFIYTEGYEPLIELADIIKVDFLNSSEGYIGDLAKKVKSNPRKVLLAEKIETYEAFEMARALGFTLFQGFFFCKPAIATSSRVDAMRLSKLQLIRSIADPEINFADLAEIIKRDVVLSYRLLKIVNSAYYGLNYSVTGILHALTILGLNDIRKWVSLIVLNQTKSSKPSELIRMALIRGIFMESLARNINEYRSAESYFLIGLFSLADAIMDVSIETIMKETHLSSEISEPLITQKGEKAELLQIIKHIERAEWDEAMEICNKYNIDGDKVYKLYVEAIINANKLLK
ncbi:MAG TPA: HDOD domain-containing protein [Clostridiales bacterium]|nr:HDOD domain-containing protein [Clostridiales bacterium]